VVLVGLDVGIVARNRREALVPERHRVDDAVRLGRRGDVLLARLRQLEGIAHDPVAAAPSEHRLCIAISFSVRRTAGRRSRNNSPSLFLAHDVEIDIARGAVLQRRIDAGEETHRPQVECIAESGGAAGSAIPTARHGPARRG